MHKGLAGLQDGALFAYLVLCFHYCSLADVGSGQPLGSCVFGALLLGSGRHLVMGRGEVLCGAIPALLYGEVSPAKADFRFLSTGASSPKHKAQPGQAAGQSVEGLGWVCPSDPCMDVGAAAFPRVSSEAALCVGGD